MTVKRDTLEKLGRFLLRGLRSGASTVSIVELLRNNWACAEMPRPRSSGRPIQAFHRSNDWIHAPAPHTRLSIDATGDGQLARR
jgi:hypothetical protein